MPVSGSDNNWFTPGMQLSIEQRRRSIAPFQQPLYMPRRENAPGWREVGQYFSLVEHPMYPRDPAVTKALRVFDPTLIPMGCYWVFDAPLDDAGHFRTEVFYRHALGRYKWDPSNPPPQLSVVIPPGYSGSVPNVLERVCDYGGREPQDDDADLPGPFEPWNWTLYAKLRHEFTRDPEDLKEGQRRKADAKARKKAFMREDFLHEMDHVQRFVEKVAENLSDLEIKEFFQALGRAQPAVKKPFIHLGS